jgi:hypothetical protein
MGNGLYTINSAAYPNAYATLGNNYRVEGTAEWMGWGLRSVGGNYYTSVLSSHYVSSPDLDFIGLSYIRMDGVRHSKTNQ